LAVVEEGEMKEEERGTSSSQVVGKVQEREDLAELSEENIRGVFSLLGLETADDRQVFCALGSVGQVQVLSTTPPVTVAANSTVAPNVEEVANA
jgi:hypothetical protein